MKHVFVTISVVISILIIMFALYNVERKQERETKGEEISSVSREGDTQIISVVTTSRGYYPRSITAKANTKTVLRMESKNSYGCERSFRIPKLNIKEVLPQQGITEFELGIPEKGEKILGTCSMGMYTFTIKFE